MGKRMILTEEGILINFSNVTDLEIISDSLVAHTVTKEVIHIKTFETTEEAIIIMKMIPSHLLRDGFITFAGV